MFGDTAINKKHGIIRSDSRVDDILKVPLEDEPKKVSALREALKVPFSTLERYSEYVTTKLVLQLIKVSRDWSP